MWFEAISVLRINLEKSDLIFNGKGVKNLDDVLIKLGRKVGSFPLIWDFLWVLRLSLQ